MSDYTNDLRDLTTWRERVIVEHGELHNKTKKLEAFLSTEDFEGLPKLDQILLIKQYGHMVDYLRVLEMRLGGGLLESGEKS